MSLSSNPCSGAVKLKIRRSRACIAPSRVVRPGGALLLLLGLVFLPGCQSVQPWERGTFADYTMRPDRDPLHTAMAEHIYFSREASSGGRGVGGSGCGCN